MTRVAPAVYAAGGVIRTVTSRRQDRQRYEGASHGFMRAVSNDYDLRGVFDERVGFAQNPSVREPGATALLFHEEAAFPIKLPGIPTFYKPKISNRDIRRALRH